MKISVIGAGYVGLTTGTALAEIGHNVAFFDVSSQKVSVLKKGKSPILEPYLERLIKKNLKKGKIFFSDEFKKVFDFAQVIFVCVDTPPLKNGEADLSQLKDVFNNISKYLKSYKAVILKSTVPPKTSDYFDDYLKKKIKGKIKFDIVSNPEFLVEGRALESFLHPDRIVVGAESQKAKKIMQKVYQPIIERSFYCPVHKQYHKAENKMPFLATDRVSAEIIKYASNSFLALKISFINAIADIAEIFGGNIDDISLGIGLDKRIGKAFLGAGIGYGGSCLPKDTAAFIKKALEKGYDFKLLKEVKKINQQRTLVALKKIEKLLGSLKGREIALWGLAFKEGTDDIRFSPAVSLAKLLLKKGAKIKAYDVKAIKNAQKVVKGINYFDSLYKPLKNTSLLAVCNKEEEFKKANWRKVKKLLKKPIVFDCRNFLDKERLKKLGFKYEAFGR